MAWRLLVGKVYRTNDTPWVNTPVIFRRKIGSYTTNIQYPPDALNFSTNSTGDIVTVDSNGNQSSGCRLWVNEEGDKISNYECLVGRDRFDFSLPLGDGSPIELSVVRAGSAPVEEYPQSIIDYVDAAVASVSGQASYYQVFTPSNNQTVFELANVSQFPNKSKVYVNGLKQQFGIDYNIDSNILNWLSSFILNNTYILEVYY